MTEEERAEIRRAIAAQIDELTHMVEAHKASSKPVEPDVAIGRLTRMEAIGAKSISEASLASARARLTRLKTALERIDDDEDFGLCAECDDPIPFRRLMLIPEATRCVGCAEKG